MIDKNSYSDTYLNLYKKLIEAFLISSDREIRIDITHLSKDAVRAITRYYNSKNPYTKKLGIKFFNNESVVYVIKLYSPGPRTFGLYGPAAHLYKLGDTYPYKPTPPTPSHEPQYYGSIAEVTEKIEEALKKSHYSIVDKLSENGLKNYHFIYKYNNTESHAEITPPWYKQPLEVCEDLRINICHKLNNYIDSSDLNLIISYHNNQFIFDIYVEGIDDTIKKKIDNDIAVPCFIVHGWGGMELTFSEIKEE